MSTANTKKNSNKNTAETAANKNASGEATAEVLYQRLGDRWFAFSVIDDEVFVGSMTPEEIQGKAPAAQKTFKITGNS